MTKTITKIRTGTTIATIKVNGLDLVRGGSEAVGLGSTKELEVKLDTVSKIYSNMSNKELQKIATLSCFKNEISVHVHMLCIITYT